MRFYLSLMLFAFVALLAEYSVANEQTFYHDGTYELVYYVHVNYEPVVLTEEVKTSEVIANEGKSGRSQNKNIVAFQGFYFQGTSKNKDQVSLS